MRRRGVCMAGAIAGALLAVACGSDETSSGARASAVTGEVSVFAAASLTAAYTEIGTAFSDVHPDATVTLNFASSSDLVTQIREGAPADVFASADEVNMDRLVQGDGNDGAPQVFATSPLQIIVGPGNPKRIDSVDDVARADVIYVTCAPEVPIGRYAAQVLERAGVVVEPASFEESVKGIVTKVALGEADAGIVYRTDVVAAGRDAAGVVIPPELNVSARYPLVVTADAPNPAGARAFVAFVLGPQGQRILTDHGFGPP